MGKKMKAALAKVEPRLYGLKEAVEVVKQTAYAKFDESVDMALRLGVDPKRADQMVRGTTVLPHGTGKKVRVLVFAKGEKEQEARAAGADYVGADDLMEKIRGGWMEFDQAISTPDLMASVKKSRRAKAPSNKAYAKQIKAVRKRYPFIKTFQTWNEANQGLQPTSRLQLAIGHPAAGLQRLEVFLDVPAIMPSKSEVGRPGSR